MKNISRRDFLKYLGAGAWGLVVAPKLGKSGPLSRLARAGRGVLDGSFSSDVVQCYDENATSGSTINEAVVQVMMDASVKALTGLNDVGEAWKSLFPDITQSSVIGIKVCNGNSLIATHPAVVRSMIDGLVQMNVGGSNFLKNNIIIWEAHDSQLTQAGFTIYDGSDPDTARCFGTDHSGIGFDDTVTFNINGTSAHPSRILSQMSDYQINASTLRTHSLSVVTLGMKNHYGSVSAVQHTNNCNPALPALSQQIRDVITPNNIQKLHVVDGLFGLYSGGPGGSPNFNPKLLLMSRDPVACEAQGQTVINAERQAHGLGALDAAHITTAAQPPYSLGTTDVNLIELNTTVGVSESDALGDRDGVVSVMPQPMRDHATLTISLSHPARVRVDLVDMAGRVVADAYQGRLSAGRHQIDFRVQQPLASGAHFFRVRCGSTSRQHKVMVL
jgi:uncharacterized protein (DUF362 family)